MTVTDILKIILDCFVKKSNHKILVWLFSHVKFWGKLNILDILKHKFVFTLKHSLFFF